MKIILIAFLFPIFLTGKLSWLTDLDQAQKMASNRHEFILLNFSGSDWCGPCIKLHDEIFESETFAQYATSHLILLNADFPRLRKNQLSSVQQAKNNALADKYNPNGIFPYTLLLDSSGTVIKTWEGFFEAGSERFTEQIKNELSGRAN